MAQKSCEIKGYGWAFPTIFLFCFFFCFAHFYTYFVLLYAFIQNETWPTRFRAKVTFFLGNLRLRNSCWFCFFFFHFLHVYTPSFLMLLPLLFLLFIISVYRTVFIHNVSLFKTHSWTRKKILYLTWVNSKNVIYSAKGLKSILF